MSTREALKANVSKTAITAVKFTTEDQYAERDVLAITKFIVLRRQAGTDRI